MAETLHTTCCIAGGGPAGMMLGLLLARAGVDVTVLEKHADFLRDFRGDTVHPSTLEIMHELGLLEAFLERPHQEIPNIGVVVGNEALTIADFTHLPTHCQFLALMPQWDFLKFVAAEAGRYPSFHLRMETEVTGLLRDGDRVTGVVAGDLEIRADLVIGADGRHSTVRQKAGLEVIELGAPIDVLWLRLSRHPGDDSQTLGRVNQGRMLVMLDRGDYWQCAYVIRKGGYEPLRERGLEAFCGDLVRLAPQLADRVGELKSWDDIKLLTVSVDRLSTWHRPGLLCIGDSAHAMSPIGGVGINLAIQDAVATANHLAGRLKAKMVTEADLQAVQERRTFPTKATQRMQILIQDRVLDRFLGSDKQFSLPLPFRLLRLFPYLQRLPARLLGLGFRPEHVRSPIQL